LEKIQHRYTKMIMHMQDKAYEERLRGLRLGPLKRVETGMILLRFLRYTGGLVVFYCMNFSHWIKTVSSQGGTRANWLRPGALGILPSISFQIKLSTDGICWTSRWLMLPAPMHSSLD